MADDPNNWESHRMLVLDSLAKTHVGLSSIQTILQQIQLQQAVSTQMATESKEKLDDLSTQMKDDFTEHEGRISVLETHKERWIGKSSVISSLIAAVVGVLSGWFINSPPSGPPGS